MLLQTFAGGWALCLDPISDDTASIFVDGVDDTVNSIADTSRLNTFEQMYVTAFNTLEQCFDYNGRVWLNEAGAFAAIEKGQYPQTVTARIGSIANYSIGYLGGLGNLTGWVELKSYSDIPIQNTSGGQALFSVYALYNHTTFIPGLGWTTLPLASTVNISLNSGDSLAVPVYYTQGQNGASPDAGTTVRLFVLGSNGSGTFSVGEFDTVWAANWLPESAPAVGSDAKPIPQAPRPQDNTNNIPTIPNPVAAYWTYSPSNQAYHVQLKIANPFDLPLAAVITQTIPANIAVSSTDGVFDDSNSIITWTNDLLPYMNVIANFSFTCGAPYGSSFTLPAAALLLEDPNSGATLNVSGNAPQLTGSATVQVSGLIPNGTLGLDSQMQLTVTNLSSVNQAGALTVTLADSTGTVLMNLGQAFSLGGSGGTNLDFTLPGSLPAGSYLLTGSLSIGGGTGQVLAGTYVVRAPPVTLSLTSASPLTTNGLSLSLSGPVGNYLVEASTDISNPTNWEPLLFYSTTNSPFYLNFTDLAATNYPCRFYRAMLSP